MNPSKNRLQIGKLLLIAVPTVFIFLLIWIGTVYIGNTYFGSTASSGQFLLWILSGAIIFVGFPIATKQIFHLGSFSKNDSIAQEVQKTQKFSKSDWLFFLLIHSIAIPILFWTFSDLQHHVLIYNYFVDIFGKNYRGAPNFPILIAFVFATLFLLTFIYVLFLKLKYGTFSNPKGLTDVDERNFKQKQEIYFSFVASSMFTVMMLYFLKMILLV
ncbi:hypothetical protein GEO21_17715 [Sphingobacterium faecium]|uniref:hypothetical protein n=1 Tax=Sphingobacterium faecium TaxID=34087 RepID=UPI001290F238|nr:hypothetical protein [Sphingobacterium faecium]MQP29333.1 hypothetical protein [Sphingobacterium faecium]